MNDLAHRKKRLALSVGEAVRFIRELRAMSQEQLAALAELPPPAVVAIENDRIPLGVRQARALAMALRCHPGVLLFPDWGFTCPPADADRKPEKAQTRRVSAPAGSYARTAKPGAATESIA